MNIFHCARRTEGNLKGNFQSASAEYCSFVRRKTRLTTAPFIVKILNFAYVSRSGSLHVLDYCTGEMSVVFGNDNSIKLNGHSVLK